MAAKAGTKPPRQARPPKGEQNGGDGRAISPKDNELGVEEANRVQLISYKTRLMQSMDVEDELAAKLKAQRANTTALFKLAEASSFSKVRMKRHLKILRGGQTSREIAEDIRAETWERETLGIPTGETQRSLLDIGTPQEVRDEAFWRSEGYLAYQRNKPCEAPSQCEQRFVQAFITGWQDAQTATALAMKKAPPDPIVVNVNRVPPKAPKAEKASAVKPAAEVAAQARADFTQDQLDEARRTGTITDDDPLGANPKPGDDGFEATPEELAAQTGRKVIEEQRAADEPEPV